MFSYYEKRELIDNYLNALGLKKGLYIGRGLDIADAVIGYIKADYHNRDSKYNNLVKTLWTTKTKHIEDIFTGLKLGALKLLLGDKYAQTFKEVWDRSPQYIYSTGYERRSFRTNISTVLYLNKNIEKLEEFIYLAACDFSLDKYLENNKDFQDISVIADIISIEIDNNNSKVMDKIRHIIYSDNNNSVVTREIIKGMLMSRSEEAHRIIGDLLLAAKLQEGLRQAVVESMDECSKEGFIYLLKVIIDNNLSRFSSIIRAFGTWTGLAIDTEKPKIINKCLEAAYKCLIDKDYLKECINSSDNLLIYIGIWAVAFNEVEDIEAIINKLVYSEVKYKKLVALQFLYQAQFDVYSHSIASKVLQIEKDLEVIAFAVKNLYREVNLYSLLHNSGSSLVPYANLGNGYQGSILFESLKAIIDSMPKKEIEFKGSVFPWVDIKLAKTDITEKMVMSLVKSNSQELIDTLIEYKDRMSVDARQVLVEIFLNKPLSVKQKTALIEFCGDRSSTVRESAFSIVENIVLSNEDYILIEGFLQYKSGDLRKNAIKLLLKQKSWDLQESVIRLLSSSNENTRLAAIDIISAMELDDNHKKIHGKCLEIINSSSNKTQREKILAENISGDSRNDKSIENGFGLFDISKETDIPKIKCSENIKSMLNINSKELDDILNKFTSFINENRDFEYETEHWDGSKRVVTLGGTDWLEPFNKEKNDLDNYPLADKIRELAKMLGLDCSKLIAIDFYIEAIRRLEYESYMPWYEKIIDSIFNFKELKKTLLAAKKMPYFNKAAEYIGLLVKDIGKSEKFEIGKSVSEYLFSQVPPENHHKDYLSQDYFYYGREEKDYISKSLEVRYWLTLIGENHYDDESFIKYFTIAYNYYRSSEYSCSQVITLKDLGCALDLEIIDENEVYKELLLRPLSPQNIRSFTSEHRYEKNEIQKYSKLVDIGNAVLDTVSKIEVARGELNTEVTHLAACINKCIGLEIFVSILLSLEKDTYVRGYNFVSGDCTKKQMLSHLLKCCYPAKGDDAETLKMLLKGRKVTDKQLIEAAMYSPQWLDIVSDYLGFKGLKSACWYFHAHVNDFFSEEKIAMVARYSPIDVQDLKDGAFDQEWFIDAYNTLGEKVFKIVYDSAKYVAGGGLHRRSQLFADATLGKLDADEVKARVMDKRNKDYLLAYGLIPIRDKDDILNRYEYIHLYIKEAKNFGSQRQASETRSANIALLNLARNAGYSDVNRLTWNMETAKLDYIRDYLNPHTIEDTEIKLEIDGLGRAEILCSKQGKNLKDIPPKYKKHEYVQQIKAVKKSLKDQYIRARQCFEFSMEREDEFNAGELSNLCSNPVLSPIIKNLVFVSGEKLGYFSDGGLVHFNSEIYSLNPDDKVIIAHPVHLFESGSWSDYQKDIFSRQIVQPFKQVFRELYLRNEDELKEGTVSRRYAGHQIQPKKAAALLKTRGWLASYEEGLQKVFYKENIVATIYALADWFSPSDIEAPTIEIVRFEDRKTFLPVPIDKIPKAIFSEVMRDVDLVVSVAHVGGVDPEASLSTIEIRRAIVDELLKLLKLDNVKLKENHAYIEGVHGEYTVHLGSGTVHKMAAGSINILPVHSSHRGRIFLPFIDEDPKSAEVISKIILLAEDKKLKDPGILVQITE